MEKIKVPLPVYFLSEQGLLVRAAALLGYKIELKPDGTGVPVGATAKGIPAKMVRACGNHGGCVECNTAPVFLKWGDFMLFTVAQLFELDFEPGLFKYCPDCGKLEVECKQEQSDILDHNSYQPSAG